MRQNSRIHILIAALLIMIAGLFFYGCPPPRPSVTPGEMVSIAAGAFEMGDPFNEGNLDEQPVHTVTLCAYEIGKYEVKNQDYADILNWANEQGYLLWASSAVIEAYGQALVDMNDPSCRITWNGAQFVVDTRDGYSMADHPVLSVSWYGAAVYCNWLSESQGLASCYDTSTWSCDFTRHGYHLPTEAQWEGAAAWDGSAHLRYGNGSDSITCAMANYHDGWGYCNPQALSEDPYTAPVGYYTGAASPAGCFDMSGNAWEWCNDWDGRVYTENPVTNPKGPASGSYRLLRGGSWYSFANDCRSASRSCSEPGARDNFFGFRVARTLGDSTEGEGEGFSEGEGAIEVTDLAVDITSVSLSLASPSARVMVNNVGNGVLSWIASSNNAAVWADPGEDQGNSQEVSIHSNDFSDSYTAELSFQNTVDALDFEVVQVQVIGTNSYPVRPGEMTQMEAGSFLMGSADEEGESNEKPVHELSLSAYEIATHEVTNQEFVDGLNWANEQGYLDVASSTTADAYGVQLLDLYDSDCQISYADGAFVVDSRNDDSMATHPVVEVSWYGAAAYCNWLSLCLGFEPCYDTGAWTCDCTKNGYHLPTEAQWERAAAWDGAYHYRYGNGSDSISCATANHLDESDFCNPLGFLTDPYTTPVGYYSDAASPAGCFDMSGNVWEWCNDWDGRVYTEEAETNPQGPTSGSYRVLRGGSWCDLANSCRSAKRYSHHPDYTYDLYGFRIARTL